MKNILAIWLGFWVLTMVLVFIFMKLDIWFNPWLYDIIDQWKWYNFLTSHHGPTALYIKHPTIWIILFPPFTFLVSGLAIFSSKYR